MNHFSSESTILDVINDKELKPYSKYFYYEFPEEIYHKKIDDTSWYARDAINWFYDKKAEGKTSIHFVGKNINIIQISHQKGAKFAFIVSGGGFICIDTAHEGMPIGKELYDQGYNIFLLTYRLNAGQDKATNDINKALEFINKNQKTLNVDVCDFILIGGSAGAYIASSYCSNNRGYLKKGNIKPKCLCLLYPIVDFHMPEKYIKDIVIGKNPSNYLINKYSITNHVKGSFPATFIVHSKDDDCVPYTQSKVLYEALRKNNIKSQLLLFETGKHGWGIGKKLEPESWFKSFIKFLGNL